MFGLERPTRQSFLRVSTDLAQFSRSLDYFRETALPRVLDTCLVEGQLDLAKIKECTM